MNLHPAVAPCPVPKRPQRAWPAPRTDLDALTRELLERHGPAARVALRRLGWAGQLAAGQYPQADRRLAAQGVPARLQPSLLGEADTPS